MLFNVSRMLDFREEDHNRIYHPDLSTEIVQWRKRLRSAEYPLKPTESRPHMSLTSQLVDEGLQLFSSHCKGRVSFNFFLSTETRREYTYYMFLSSLHVYLYNS